MPIQLSPFSKLLPYLIFGIILNDTVRIDQAALWSILSIGIFTTIFFHFLFYKYSRPKRVIGFQLGVFLVFSCVGALLNNDVVNELGLKNKQFDHKIYANALVKDVHYSDSSSTINISILNGYIGDTVLGNSIGAIIKDKKNEFLNVLPDDQLFIEGKAHTFFENTNPGAFNYRDYMEENGNYLQISANTLKVLHRPNWSIWRLVYQVRNYLTNILKNHLEIRELGVAQALILGQKQFLEIETKQAFAGVGAMHILAVSGLHVGLVFLLFSALFKPLINLPNGNIIQTILVITVIVCYAAITGFSPSVTRASLMFILISLGIMLRRVGDTYNTIFASAFLMLIYQPKLLFNIGFQLSYIAVLGIIFIYPKLFKCLEPKLWITNKIWSLLCLALAAQLVTFPLGLYYFHQFPTYFFITNLVVIPAAFAVLFGGFALFFSNAFTELGFPIIENSLGWIFQKLVWLLNEFIEMLYSFPMSSITQIEISIVQLFYIYLIILCVIIFLIYRKGFFLTTGFAFALLLCISFSWRKFEVLSSSGVLIYQYNSPVIEVFEGKNSRCYAGFINPKKQIYFDRMIQDFNRNEGRFTDTLIKAYILKRNSIEYVSLLHGESEIQLVENSILFKTIAVAQTQNFNLDSARIIVVSK